MDNKDLFVIVLFISLTLFGSFVLLLYSVDGELIEFDSNLVQIEPPQTDVPNFVNYRLHFNNGYIVLLPYGRLEYMQITFQFNVTYHVTCKRERYIFQGNRPVYGEEILLLVSG